MVESVTYSGKLYEKKKTVRKKKKLIKIVSIIIN